MPQDQTLLLRVLRLLTDKTEAGRIPWSESVRDGRYLAVVSGQTYVLTSNIDSEGHDPPEIVVTATDEDGGRMWSATHDLDAPGELRDSPDVQQAVLRLAESIHKYLDRSRVSKLRHSLEALTAA